MAAHTQRLRYETDAGETGSATIYWNSVDRAEPRLCVSVDGDTGYIKLGGATDASATPLRVHLDSDGNDYAILADAATEVVVYNIPFVTAALNETTLQEAEPNLSVSAAFANIPTVWDISETGLSERD